jgi:glycerate-2-kinase
MSKVILKNIYTYALEQVKGSSIVANNISKQENSLTICKENIPYDSFEKLYIFSVGKAGYEMAQVCEDILGDLIDDGLSISLSDKKLSIIQTMQSSHPILSEKSLQCAQKLITMIKQMNEKDFFIFFLSGGASAMIEQPIDGIDLENFQKISQALIGSGVDIKVLNTVRKSISQVKAGKLANNAKANGRVLVLSDVIGDDLNTIGSAPMYNKKVPHTIIGNNTIALEGAKSFIEKDVQKCEIVTTTLDMDSQSAANFIGKKIHAYDEKYESFCLLFGGETTTEILGDGVGGRNQELALRLLLEDVITPNISILCAGSDGIDGNSPATGAFLDFDIHESIKKFQLEPKGYLQKSDSYHFFKMLGYDFTTGASGTNVMDFIICLKTIHS